MAFRWNATKIQSFNHFGTEVWVVTETWRGNEHILILLTSRICMWTVWHSSKGILTYATSLCVKKVLRLFIVSVINFFLVSARLSNFTPLSSIFRSSYPATASHFTDIVTPPSWITILHLHLDKRSRKSLEPSLFHRKMWLAHFGLFTHQLNFIDDQILRLNQVTNWHEIVKKLLWLIINS